MQTLFFSAELRGALIEIPPEVEFTFLENEQLATSREDTFLARKLQSLQSGDRYFLFQERYKREVTPLYRYVVTQSALCNPWYISNCTWVMLNPNSYPSLRLKSFGPIVGQFSSKHYALFQADPCYSTHCIGIIWLQT